MQNLIITLLLAIPFIAIVAFAWVVIRKRNKPEARLLVETTPDRYEFRLINGRIWMIDLTESGKARPLTNKEEDLWTKGIKIPKF